MTWNQTEKVRKAADMIANDCVAMRVRYLNRTLTAFYDDAYRPLGITASQGNMLVAVINRGTLSPTELGRLLNIEKSTLSRNLERMRKAGWIEVRTSGRTHEIEATRAGRQLLVELLPQWRKAQNEAAGLLGDEGCATLRDVGDLARQQLSTP